MFTAYDLALEKFDNHTFGLASALLARRDVRNFDVSPEYDAKGKVMRIKIVAKRFIPTALLTAYVFVKVFRNVINPLAEIELHARYDFNKRRGVVELPVVPGIELACHVFDTAMLK